MITQEQAIQAQTKLFEIAMETVKSKRADYSGTVDPFANFRTSLFWDVPPWKGAEIRRMDKISRFKELSGKVGEGAVKNESMIDTVVDDLNYRCISFILWMDENRPDMLKELLGEADPRD